MPCPFYSFYTYLLGFFVETFVSTLILYEKKRYFFRRSLSQRPRGGGDDFSKQIEPFLIEIFYKAIYAIITFISVFLTICKEADVRSCLYSLYSSNVTFFCHFSLLYNPISAISSLARSNGSYSSLLESESTS